jgi:enamine deaminase RidA (YjgF/YER057c/UK114 family)
MGRSSLAAGNARLAHGKSIVQTSVLKHKARTRAKVGTSLAIPPITETDMTGTIDATLASLGITIPTPVAPAANYVPTVVSGNLLFVSGQISVTADGTKLTGKLGETADVEAGRTAARQCGINLIAQIKAALGGDLDRVKRVVKLTGFVNSAPDFTDQPKVVNGCSDLFVEVFGETGRHARSAVGVAQLPFGVSVEVEAIIEIA